MSGHRQSALLLHSLGKTDQSWILAQLGQADAHILSGYLSELKELGIPADPALAARNGRGIAAHGSAAAIHRASAAAMHLLLADEPAWMVGHLLALGQWPWREAFLDTLPPSQRERLTTTVIVPALRAEISERLLALMAAKLVTRGAAEPGKAPAAGLLQNLRQSLRRRM